MVTPGVKLIFHNSLSVPSNQEPNSNCVTIRSLRHSLIVPVAIRRGGETVRSLVLKRSIVIAGHKTSVSLEDEFWKSLKEIAGERGMTLAQLVAAIDGNRQHGNLSSAIRLFVLASIAISVLRQNQRSP